MHAGVKKKEKHWREKNMERENLQNCSHNYSPSCYITFFFLSFYTSLWGLTCLISLLLCFLSRFLLQHGLIYSPILGDFLLEPLDRHKCNSRSSTGRRSHVEKKILGCWHVLYQMPGFNRAGKCATSNISSRRSSKGKEPFKLSGRKKKKNRC